MLFLRNKAAYWTCVSWNNFLCAKGMCAPFCHCHKLISLIQGNTSWDLQYKNVYHINKVKCWKYYLSIIFCTSYRKLISIMYFLWYCFRIVTSTYTDSQNISLKDVCKWISPKVASFSVFWDACSVGNCMVPELGDEASPLHRNWQVSCTTEYSLRNGVIRFFCTAAGLQDFYVHPEENKRLMHFAGNALYVDKHWP